MEIREICRLWVQIDTIRKDDLLALCPALPTFLSAFLHNAEG